MVHYTRGSFPFSLLNSAKNIFNHGGHWTVTWTKRLGMDLNLGLYKIQLHAGGLADPDLRKSRLLLHLSLLGIRMMMLGAAATMVRDD
jgi:hypothetical protein